VTTSFNRLVAVRPHTAGHVEASDPDIIMRRLATSERTMTPAMASRNELDTSPQLKGRLTSVAIIAVVNGLGTKLNTTFASVSSQLN
jgi:hypothetical protein